MALVDSGGGTCPVCSDETEDLPHHLNSHSKEEFIKAFSSNLLLSPSNEISFQNSVSDSEAHLSGQPNLPESHQNYASTPLNASIASVDSCTSNLSPQRSMYSGIPNNPDTFNSFQLGSARPSFIQGVLQGHVQNVASPNALLYRQPVVPSNASNAFLLPNAVVNPYRNVCQTETSPFLSSQGSGGQNNEQMAGNFLNQSQQLSGCMDYAVSPPKVGLVQSTNRNVSGNQGGTYLPIGQQTMVCLLPMGANMQPGLVGSNFVSYGSNSVPIPGAAPQILQVPIPNGNGLLQNGSLISHPNTQSNQMQFFQPNFSSSPTKPLVVSRPSQTGKVSQGLTAYNESCADTYGNNLSLKQQPDIRRRKFAHDNNQEKDDDTVIELGKYIKIALPKEIAGKKERLKQLINRELVHAILINDSDNEEDSSPAKEDPPVTTCDPNVGTEEKLAPLNVNYGCATNQPFVSSSNNFQDIRSCTSTTQLLSLNLDNSHNLRYHNEGNTASCTISTHRKLQTNFIDDDKDESLMKVNDCVLTEEFNQQFNFLSDEKDDSLFQNSSLIGGMTHSDQPTLCVEVVDDADGNTSAESEDDKLIIIKSDSISDVPHQKSKEDYNMGGSSNFLLFDSSSVCKTYSKTVKVRKFINAPEVIACGEAMTDLLDTSNIDTENHAREGVEEYVDDPIGLGELCNKSSASDDIVNRDIDSPLNNSCAVLDDPICTIKMESCPDFVNHHQEEIMSLKASEILEESEDEIVNSSDDIGQGFYGKPCIFTGEPVLPQLNPKKLEGRINSSQEFESVSPIKSPSNSFCYANSVAATTSTAKCILKENAIDSLNLTLDANCSILPGDTLIIPQLLDQFENSNVEDLKQYNLDIEVKVDARDKEEMSPLASTSGLQKLTSPNSKRIGEDDEYDFEYESDCYADSDSDACIGLRSSFDMDRWRCSRCNKTFKSLKEKLLHAGHHSPCSSDRIIKKSSLADVKRKDSLKECVKTKTSEVINNKESAENSNQVDNKLTCAEVLKMEEAISNEFVETALASLKTIDGRCRCTDCPKIFSTQEELYDHRVSFLKAKYACGVCHRLFDNRVEKLAHFKTHTTSDLKCPTCYRVFPSHYAWCQHQLFHLGLMYYDCNECGRKFQRKGELVIHLRRHTGEKPYVCYVCHKTFAANQALKKHLLIHMAGQEVECDVCQKRCKNSVSLSKHKFLMHPKKRKTLRKRTDHMCHVCNEIFVSERKLAWHQETHERWPKKCQQCGECYVHQSNLTKHIRQKHDSAHIPKGERNKNCSKCPICMKVYQKSSLAMHMLVHNGVKPYKCNVCSKEFSIKCNYLTHRWVHMGPRDRPFKCKLCDRSFHRKRFLEAHIRSHKNIRPYTCNECGKSFIHKNNLQTHIKEHSGLKLHSCEVCNKSFFRKYNLNNHIRIHTGVTPYVCTICRKKFTQKSNYNVHMKAFHIERHAVHEEV